MQNFIIKIIVMWARILCKDATPNNEQIFQLSQEEITVILFVLIVLAVAGGAAVIWTAIRLLPAVPRPSGPFFSNLLESIITTIQTRETSRAET
jgi:hypothetical protein